MTQPEPKGDFKPDFSSAIISLQREENERLTRELVWTTERWNIAKTELSNCVERLDRHHVCGYTTGNQPEPCPTCEYIKSMQAEPKEER